MTKSVYPLLSRAVTKVLFKGKLMVFQTLSGFPVNST